MSGLARLLVLLIMAVPVVPSSYAAPALQLIPDSAHPGDQVKVKGSGFDSCFPKPGPGTHNGINGDTGTHGGIPDGDTGTRDGNPPTPTPTPNVPPKVTVRWDGSNNNGVLTTVALGGDGAFTTTFVVPPALRPGSYEVAAECGDPNSPDMPGEIVFADLTVTAVPPPPSPTLSPKPSAGPSPTPPVETSSELVPPTSLPTSVFPTPAPPTPPPPPPPPPPEPTPLGWLVVLGVVAVLVALAALGRRLLRPRPRPERSPRLPVVQAVLRPGTGGSVELSRTGPGRSVAIRVVAREDPGVQVVQRIGG